MEKDLKTLLNEGIVEFTFKKVNGEIRKARGSRNTSVLMATAEAGFTEADMPKSSTENTSACAFWDIDKQAWRSARYDSVISIEKTLSEEQLLGKSIEF